MNAVQPTRKPAEKPSVPTRTGDRFLTRKSVSSQNRTARGFSLPSAMRV